MTLKDRAILAYEAKREAERVEAEQSAIRAREAWEIKLQNLCRSILQLDQLDIPAQWVTGTTNTPQQVPVVEIDGLHFTCYETDSGGLEPHLRMIFFYQSKADAYRLHSLESLGKTLSVPTNTGEIRGGSIYPATNKT